MVRLTEEDIDDTYVRVYLNLISAQAFSNRKNHPDFFTFKKKENGFEEVRYYKKKIYKNSW